MQMAKILRSKTFRLRHGLDVQVSNLLCNVTYIQKMNPFGIIAWRKYSASAIQYSRIDLFMGSWDR